MASGEDGYRDALAAAQSRITALEKSVADQRGTTERAARFAALQRERARVAAPPDDTELRRAVRRVSIIAGASALAFALSGSWGFAIAAATIPVVVWTVGRAFLRTSAGTNAKQLALIDTELAELQREREEPPRGSAS